MKINKRVIVKIILSITTDVKGEELLKSEFGATIDRIYMGLPVVDVAEVNVTIFNAERYILIDMYTCDMLY